MHYRILLRYDRVSFNFLRRQQCQYLQDGMSEFQMVPLVFDYVLANAHQNPFGFVGDCLERLITSYVTLSHC